MRELTGKQYDALLHAMAEETLKTANVSTLAAIRDHCQGPRRLELLEEITKWTRGLASNDEYIRKIDAEIISRGKTGQSHAILSPDTAPVPPNLRRR